LGQGRGRDPCGEGAKADSRDALHILDLLLTNRFPRIWIPSAAERDVRQRLRHRHKLVRYRTSVMNQLHGRAMGQGLWQRKKLWTTEGRPELKGLRLDPWASRRRRELLPLLDQLDPWIDERTGITLLALKWPPKNHG
jgi:transposase